MKHMDRMAWAALLAFAVSFAAMAGGYAVGKDLAQRDNAQQQDN